MIVPTDVVAQDIEIGDDLPGGLFRVHLECHDACRKHDPSKSDGIDTHAPAQLGP